MGSAHVCFYRRRGADFGDARPVIVVFRAAFLLIANFVVVDLARRTAHRL
jgi:hypothetical protein